jgi:hypothetical protein
MPRTCATCGKPLGATNKSGLCVRDFNARLNADPKTHAKRVAGIRRDAVVRREEKRRILLENAAKAMQRPERLAFLREQMKWVQPLSQTPEVLAKTDPAAKGRKRTETVLGWCPPAYREEYRRLIRSRNVNAAEARKVILDQIRNDRTAEKRKPVSFEETLQRVAEGRAQVVEKLRLPSQDYGFTLGGVSAGMVA